MTGRTKLSLPDRALAWLAGALGPCVVLLLGATWRVFAENEEVVDRVHRDGRSIVFAFWHGVLLPLEYASRGKNIQVLSSWHRDGEISARLMTALGYGVVRGSSTRGSARGLMRMLSRAVEGFDLAITPDGPRGPARRVKRGIFYLAERSGAAIVPVGVGTSSGRRLGSWDRFLVPHPLSRVAIVYGEPLRWDPSSAFEDKARLLEVELGKLTSEAERLAG